MPEPRIFGSIDEFRAAVRSAEKPAADARVRASFDTEVKADGEGRTLTFAISSPAVDRMGDTIAVDGWQLENYRKNPVVLFAHDSSSLPPAKSTKIFIEGQKLKSVAEFVPADTPVVGPLAEALLRMYRDGFMSATSVGFVPIKYSFVDDPTRRFGIDFEEQELLEYSLVPVPANPEALIEGRAAGINIAPMLKWAEDVIALAVARADTPNWKCSAARNLPIDESDAWDGAAAAARMLDAAGFNGDNPDAAKARRGFLAWDSGNPTLKGSYKLPFADIIGGRLEAVAGGLRNAASRLPQTDIPQNVKDEARSVLDGYFARINPQDGASAQDRAEALLRDEASAERIMKLAESVLGSNGKDMVALAWAERIMRSAGRTILTPERTSKIAKLESAAAADRVRRRQQRLAVLRLKGTSVAGG